MIKKKTVKKKTAAKPAKPAPKSQVLPGMEQVRDQELENLCEAISENRGEMNRLRGEEVGLEQSALRRMQTKGRKFFQWSGVELALVPGDMKLRVRTLKAKATATADETSEDE